MAGLLAVGGWWSYRWAVRRVPAPDGGTPPSTGAGPADAVRPRLLRGGRRRAGRRIGPPIGAPDRLPGAACPMRRVPGRAVLRRSCRPRVPRPRRSPGPPVRPHGRGPCATDPDRRRDPADEIPRSAVRRHTPDRPTGADSLHRKAEGRQTHGPGRARGTRRDGNPGRRGRAWAAAHGRGRRGSSSGGCRGAGGTTAPQRGRTRRTASAAPPGSGWASDHGTPANRVGRERCRDRPHTLWFAPCSQAWTSPAGSRRPSSSSHH